jgi:hypothetical protein
MHVELSRRLSTQGVTVARIDVPGLGDAPGHADAPDNHPYTRHALHDLRRTLCALRDHCQPATLHAAGLCSGAYHVLQLAATGRLLDSATIINPLTFHWREGMVITIPEGRVVAESARYQRRALELSAWVKLLRGRVAYRRLSRIIARRTAHYLSRGVRRVSALIGLPIHSRLHHTLTAAARHGVTLRFLFADSDPGLAMLREQAGDTVTELQRTQRVRIDVIANADHTFIHRLPRQQLLATIAAGLCAPGHSAKQ